MATSSALACAAISGVAYGQTNVPFTDDFLGNSLDSTRWNVLEGAAAIAVTSGELQLSGAPEHKRLDTQLNYYPSVGPVTAEAKIAFGGDYEKFGFGMAGPVSIYFDTYDNSLGSNANSIRALVYSVPGGGNIYSQQVAMSWGGFHTLSIAVGAGEVAFQIDNSQVGQFAMLTDGLELPVGLWNDRTPTMRVDSVSVVPEPSTAITLFLGLLAVASVPSRRPPKSNERVA